MENFSGEVDGMEWQWVVRLFFDGMSAMYTLQVSHYECGRIGGVAGRRQAEGSPISISISIWATLIGAT